MLIYILLLAASAAYAIRYAVYCFSHSRTDAGVGALLVTLLPLLCIAALVAIWITTT